MTAAAGLHFTVDVSPSLEIRLDAAKVLYVECTELLYAQHKSPNALPDFNRWADLDY